MKQRGFSRAMEVVGSSSLLDIVSGQNSWLYFSRFIITHNLNPYPQLRFSLEQAAGNKGMTEWTRKHKFFWSKKARVRKKCTEAEVWVRQNKELGKLRDMEMVACILPRWQGWKEMGWVSSLCQPPGSLWPGYLGYLCSGVECGKTLQTSFSEVHNIKCFFFFNLHLKYLVNHINFQISSPLSLRIQKLPGNTRASCHQFIKTLLFARAQGVLRAMETSEANLCSQVAVTHLEKNQQPHNGQVKGVPEGPEDWVGWW